MKELLSTIEKEIVQLVGPIEEDQGKSYDTFLFNVDKRANELGDQVQESNGPESFRELLDTKIDYDRILSEQKQKVLEIAESNPKLSQLYQLLSDTVKISPLVPMVLFNHLDFLNQTGAVLKPIHRFKTIENLPSTEERGTDVFRLYANVFEQSYKHYIILIWMLWRIKSGKSIVLGKRTIGVVINELKNAPKEFQSLVLMNSAAIRNVEYHEEPTRTYYPPADSFKWRDHKNPDLIHEHTVEYLLDSTIEMYELGARGVLELRTYFNMYFSINLMKDDYLGFVRALKEEDQNWLNTWGEDIENRLLFLGEPLRKLVA